MNDSSSRSGIYGAVENMEQVVSVITEATDGELFQLESVEPYTDKDQNWTDKSSRIGREHEDLEQSFKIRRCCGIMLADWTLYWANISKKNRL